MIIEVTKNRLDKADEIAIHHGFTLTKIPPSYTKNKGVFHPDEKVAVIKNYKKKFFVKNHEPDMFYYDRPILLNKKNPSAVSRNYKRMGLDIVGIKNSIAEAIIINTAIKILKEEGYENLSVDLNCTGDRESISRFIDEQKSYYKKNLVLLDGCCKKCLNKKNNVILLECDHGGCKSVQKNAPKPMNFLSEKSRQHFKEILEYLEEMNIPYRINDTLISEGNHYSKTIFEIKTEIQNKKENKEMTLAKGGRYDESANRIAKKRSLVATGISLQFKKQKSNKAYSNKIKKPEILLIQFGFMAKIKSFEVIDILRKNKITIHQNLHIEKLSDQFEIAKKMGIPNIIIIGHQEALDNVINFRNIKKASQEIVKIEKIPQYLKKIKMV